MGPKTANLRMRSDPVYDRHVDALELTDDSPEQILDLLEFLSLEQQCLLDVEVVVGLRLWRAHAETCGDPTLISDSLDKRREPKACGMISITPSSSGTLSVPKKMVKGSQFCLDSEVIVVDVLVQSVRVVVCFILVIVQLTDFERHYLGPYRGLHLSFRAGRSVRMSVEEGMVRCAGRARDSPHLPISSVSSRLSALLLWLIRVELPTFILLASSSELILLGSS